MVDVNAIKRMKSNMTGGRLVNDLVNQLLISKNQDLRCGRLMIDNRYRKLFKIKPFDIKNKLNKKSLKELFNSAPKIPITGQNYVAPMNNNTKHIINLENADSDTVSNENSGGKIGKSKNKNDLYELLYGLK